MLCGRICRNFHNTKNFETNSKQQKNEIDEQTSECIVHIDDNRPNPEESASILRWSKYCLPSLPWSLKKNELHYSQYGSLKHETLIRCMVFSDEIS